MPIKDDDKRRQYFRELMRKRRAAEKAGKPRPAPDDLAATSSKADDRLITSLRMQLGDAKEELRRFARDAETSTLVLGLRAEIKTLKGQLAHAKGQQAPPSEREARLRAANRKLSARLRAAAAKPPRGTLIMSRRDRMAIMKCLHPDKRVGVSEGEMLHAAQIWTRLMDEKRIREP